MKDNVRSSVIVNLIRTLCLTVLSFISFPYVCSALGSSFMGTYTWLNTFVYYFLIIAKSGIPNVAIRECSKVQNDKQLLSRKVQEFFIIQAVLTVLSFGLMCAFVFSVPELLEFKNLIFILSINFVIGVFSFEWVFIALEKHYFISFRSISTTALTSILIISLIKYPTFNDMTLYCVLTISSTILTVIINVIAVRKYITFKYVGPYDFKEHFKPITVVFVISLMLTIYNSTDSFILGFLDKSKTAVANYSVGIKSIEIIITLITSLDSVFIPRATKYYKLENKVFFNNLTKYGFNICLFIAIPAIATMSILSTQISTIISGGGEGYSDAPLILIILCSMSLTFSSSDMIYEQVLIPMKKEKYYLYTLAMGAILNIGGSISLGLIFKDHPAIGVAIATILTDAILLINMIFLTKEYVHSAIFNKNTLKIIIAGIAVAICSYFETLLFASLSAVLQIVLVVIIGAFVYLSLLLLMKEDLVCSFKKKKTAANE